MTPWCVMIVVSPLQTQQENRAGLLETGEFQFVCSAYNHTTNELPGLGHYSCCVLTNSAGSQQSPSFPVDNATCGGRAKFRCHFKRGHPYESAGIDRELRPSRSSRLNEKKGDICVFAPSSARFYCWPSLCPKEPAWLPGQPRSALRTWAEVSTPQFICRTEEARPMHYRGE